MPRYRVYLARDYSEYGEIEIEALSPGDAEAQIAAIFVKEPTTDAEHQAYADLVNRVTWQPANEAHNERVYDLDELDADGKIKP